MVPNGYSKPLSVEARPKPSNEIDWIVFGQEMKVDTADGSGNPKQPPGMYKTRYIMGYLYHINWWTPDFWTINSINNISQLGSLFPPPRYGCQSTTRIIPFLLPNKTFIFETGILDDGVVLQYISTKIQEILAHVLYIYIYIKKSYHWTSWEASKSESFADTLGSATTNHH